MNQSAPACAAIADFAARAGPRQRLAVDKLRTFSSPWSGWTARIGSPSPQLLALRGLLIAAEKLASEAGRPAIAAMRRDVQRVLERDQRSDAETLDPR